MGGRRQELVTEAQRLILQQDIDQYSDRYGPGISYIIPERIL